MADKINIEEMNIFCKKKGFVYSNSEIYGGIAGFFDYGPLGVELKNNIKQDWWRRFVKSREDVVGIDGAIISHPKVWEASGHVENFNDVYVKCKKCKKPNKIDKNEVGKIKCECSGEYDVIGDVNLMFKTNVGPVEGNIAYLRPETAQLIFTNFKIVSETSRAKLPFGIAQQGRAFRNEISPRDFLFRCREFEQMEIEFFIHPDEKKCPLLKKEDIDFEFQLLSEKDQEKDDGCELKITLGDMLKKKMLGEWHAYWLKENYQWFLDLGIAEKDLRLREHMKDELAHYSSACFDIEYRYPFGWKEVHGNADRGQYDLGKHQEVSKKSMELFDEESKKKVIPRVVEPSQGVDRAFLTVLFDAYEDDKERGNIVLKLHPKLAPVKVGVFPLVNKLNDDARKVYDILKDDFACQFDSSGSVGRRYARADEAGVPYCITFDFDSLEDKSVTVRDRDSTKQVRVEIEKLNQVISGLLDSKIEFDKSGKLVE
ncbi:glycine--tRNA ligase [Candidatus Woesearchaeota archaeon]|nr:glycine--tRNA ligase [Candidatus Woesearchaeota archaeon]